MRRERTLGPLLLAALGGITGCGTLLGLDDFTDQPGASATTGAGGAGSTSTSASTAASGGGGASATTGQGGAGGATFCEAGTTMPCYTGPAGTEGVGLCAAGEATCLPDGSAYGACAGDVLPAAKDDCATQEDEDCDGYQCGEAVWSQMFHGTSIESPAGVAVDATGNIYLFGDFRGSVDFGGGPLITAGGLGDYDLYLIKFAPDGTHLWSRQLGDSAAGQYAKAIAVDATGRIILAGGFYGSIDFGGTAGVVTASANQGGYVAVLDDQAQGIWARGFVTANSAPIERVAVDPSGDVFIAQTFSGNSADWGLGSMSAPSGTGMFAAKLAAGDGAKKWLVTFDKVTAGSNLATDAAGSLYVGGGAADGVDFGFGAYPTGGAVILKLTGMGALAFPVLFPTLGGGSGAATTDVATDAAGNLSAALDLIGSADIMGPKSGPGTVLFKANSLGFGQWTWFTPEQGSRLAASKAGEAVLAHGSGSAVSLTRVDPAGNVLWTRTFACSLSAQSRGVVVTPDDRIVYAGHANGTIDFGNGPFTSVALYDAFLASFAP